MKEKRSFTKKLGWFFSILLLIILIPYFIVSVILAYEKITDFNNLPSVFGYTPFIVNDNSMKGDVEKGDLLILQPKETYALLKRGDIVAFKEDNDKYKVRRIDNIVSQPKPDDNGKVAESDVAEYKTKGTNNKKADRVALISDTIIGVYLINIPKVGQVIEYINNGWLLVISIPILGLIIVGLIFLAGKCEAKKIPTQEKEEKQELMSAAELTTGQNIREELNKKMPVKNSSSNIGQQPQQVIPPQQVTTPQAQIKVVPPQQTVQQSNPTGQLAGGINIVPPSEMGNTPQTVTPNPQQATPPQAQVQVVPPQQPVQQPTTQTVVIPQNNQTQNK